jgi:pilus assembly protein CpaE
MRAGVRETIFLPLVQREVEEVVSRLRAHGAGKDGIPKTGEVLCFLPAKPGVGASTLAINTATALARKGGAKVLLVDADLGSGVIRFMLQLKHERSLRDAAKKVADLDENMWSQLVTRVNGLDVLHAGGSSPANALDPHCLLDLLDFWRRTYNIICLDFSGGMEQYSLDLLRQASKIFLVCTSELAAMHLLREKAQILKANGVAERVHAIYNRKSFSESLSQKQMQEIIEVPIFWTFRNSYAETTVACKEGRALRAGSALGLEFNAFAAVLRGDEAPAPKRNIFRDVLTAWGQKAPQQGHNVNGTKKEDKTEHQGPSSKSSLGYASSPSQVP